MLGAETVTSETVTSVTGIGQVGVGVFLLWQISALLQQVRSFLDATKLHQEKVREHLAELVIAVRRGAPAHVDREPTPIRGIDTRRSP